MSTAFRVGAFIVVALLFLSIAIFLIGNKDLLFSSTYRLQSEFPSVNGLNNGAEVRVGGTHQGTVKEIELPSQPNGKVTVVMSLRNTTRKIIRKDSTASIKTEGLLGDKYVEISFGSVKSEPVANGDTIASQTPEDLSGEARSLTAEAQQGISAFRDDMDALQHNFFLRGFFKNRGYNDAQEVTRNAIPGVLSGPREKEFDYDADKLFDKSDDAKLKNKKLLNEAGKYLEENQYSLAVVAASQVKGDTQKDKVLTEARAKVVRDYLVQNFKLDDKRLKTVGLGKSKNDNDSSKLLILVYPPKSS